MLKLYTFLVLMVFSKSYLALAQTPDSTQTDSLVKIHTLEEVEVKAMYGRLVSRRFPAAVYSSEMKDNVIFPVNINESLNRMPSVYAHTGTFNTSRITMRGIGTRSLYGTRKINALLNDIPLTSGEGDTFIDDIDLQFVNRIEVVGGPTAGIYGPALGGTLLLYTNPDAENDEIAVSFGAGSYATFQSSVAANLVNRKSAVSLIYKNVTSDGYRDNNNYNRHSALLNYKVAGQRSQWNILTLLTGVKAGIPSSIDSLTLETNPKAAAANWLKTKGNESSQRFLAGITHQYRLTSSFTSFVTVYGLYKNSTETRPFNYLKEDDRSGGIKIYFKKKLSKVEGLTLTPGISTFLEKYRPILLDNIGGVGEMGSKNAENVENIFQANAFIITEFVPDTKNFLSLSLNLTKFGISDQNVFASLPVQKYQQTLSFSPRLSASRQLLKNHFLFGSLSHGLSYPSIQEILYPDGTINNNVHPEKAWSFEVGIKGFQLFNELKYSLAFYYMPVTELIVPKRIAEDTYIGENVGKSLHSGMEVLIEKSVPLFDKASWFYVSNYRLTLNWQSNKFKDFYLDTINLKNNNLPGVPNKKLYLQINFRIKNFFFIEPEVYVNDRIAMNDENTKYYKAYTVSNVRYGFMLDYERWSLKLSSAINNITDKRYASMILINAPSVNNRPPRYYYPALPRNYFVSVTATFKI